MAALWISIGFVFFLVMFVSILTRNRMDDLDGQIRMQDAIIEDMQRAAVVRYKQLNAFKSRLYDQLTASDKVIKDILAGLLDDDIDAANTRGALLEQIRLQTEAYAELEDGHNTLVRLVSESHICQVRGGHKFECVELRMGEEVPVYGFDCPVCHMWYRAWDFELTKKEKKLAQKYIDSFK